MAHSVVINTPYPTAKQVVKRLGLSQSEWKMIEEVVDKYTVPIHRDSVTSTATTSVKKSASRKRSRASATITR